MEIYVGSMVSTLIIILLTLILGGICFLAFKWENISKRVKELEGKKPKGFMLKQIPRKPILKDVDPNNKILIDILESVKLEEWNYEVKEEPSYSSGANYTINWENPSKNIHIRSRLRMTENSNTKKFEPYLSNFFVSSQDGSLSFGDSDDFTKNQIIIFIWDYIIKYHEEQNSLTKKSYTDSIKAISDKLVTLNRDRKLNSII